MMATATGTQRAAGPSPSLRWITSFTAGQSRLSICRPWLNGAHRSQRPSRSSKIVSNAYDPRNPQQIESSVATPHSGYHFDGTPRRCKF
jgi:hypothetical protein